MTCFRSRGAQVALSLAALLTAGAALRAEQDKEEARQDQGLMNMRRSAAKYVLFSSDTSQRAFEFQKTAALRFSHPVGGSKDGTLYLWTDHGRPQAIVKLYTFDNKSYSHAWLSLSESPFVAVRDGKVIWKPAEPGISLREIRDAPQAAETAPKRLRQMRTLSDRFSANYTALDSDGKPFELRILTQPLLRYETDEDYRADGALFVFVQTTAPVGLLLLESRQTPGGHRWHYAYASLTSGTVTARYGEQEVFSAQRGNVHRDPQQPYLLLHSLPVPEK